MGVVRRRWFQILVGGFVLFIIAEQVIRASGSLQLFPAIVLLGAFTVPAAFVSYIFEYERGVDRELHRIPFSSIAVCFLAGGFIGVLAAGLIEFQALRNLGVPELFGVGLIEESVKLIFPIIFFVRGVYRTQADGLLFGVASGMGFAALETIGYALASYVQLQGDVGGVAEVLLIRSFFSPAGHAAWTGFVAAILWRERARAGRFVLSPALIGAFVVAVTLHALWNISSLDGVPGGITILAYLVLSAISITLLVRRIQEARFHGSPD